LLNFGPTFTIIQLAIGSSKNKDLFK
jgi:hypothetical protein